MCSFINKIPTNLCRYIKKTPHQIGVKFSNLLPTQMSRATISNGWFILPSPENTISDLSEITGRRA